SARKIHINDSYRILRALEVFYSTGKPRSFFEMNNNHRSKYKFLILVPERNRTDLYERINMRVEQMFADGLEAEVKKLIADGAKVSDPGMQAIGYREWFFNSDIDVIKEEIKKNSRRYAKKQYTYIKGIENACIIEFDSENELIDIVAKKIENFI
ncbi:MAG: tRNA (adenosine(37)-N6)-dimethylallyltransferase MiaA, partial [Treponema sp.]|nr:tRNA (adenosine(37)-N6)-dimethylallyltransferase MiaA [Treponema sp.]